MSNTHFGFKEVDSNKKTSLVFDVFKSVANKYDLMNDFMSFGIHHFWKKEFVSKVKDLSGKIIDVAGGTGDISFRLHKKAKEQSLKTDITICDINQHMLNIAEQKAIDSNILSGLKFHSADAENMPFQDNSFDYYLISFGIRNVTNIEKALSEAYRILKPGGKFLCLEFSQVNNIMLQKIYDLYSMNVIPKIGKFVANDEDSYRYLVESIRKFPNQQKFKQMIINAGFGNVSYKNLSSGVVAIHEGQKNVS
jgi:demethylmenaquinone methyltransferase/2-methoxy-6-polyprenyl-1,4-benzoquinol methylase